MHKPTYIGILSDTHDNRQAIQKAVALFNEREAALVVHAGDMISPFTVLDFGKLTCPMELVFGNNDGERIGLAKAFSALGTLLPGPRAFTFAGKRFLLMHEHESLDVVSSATNVDIIIYGHTHEVDVRRTTPLVINPGEAGGWLKGTSTVALLELSTMEVEIIELGGT